MSGFISVDNVRKIYRTRKDTIEAVSGASFNVEQGEFVSILGPSGCGKSTLLMMCAGLEGLTSGHSNIAGTKVEGPRQSVGIMFQDNTLLPWKTVLENILFPVRIQKKPMEHYRARAEEL